MITTHATTAAIAPEIPVVHLATDHMIEPTLSALTGTDVVLNGNLASGRPYFGRRLDNVSFVPRANSIFVIGMETGVGIRQFDLRLCSKMDVRIKSSERDVDDNMVASEEVWKTFTSDDLAALITKVAGHK